MAVVNVKQGDSRRAIVLQLKDHNDQPMDLNNIQSVSFHVENVGIIPGEVYDFNTGKVALPLTSPITDEPGAKKVDVRVDFGSTIETFPSSQYVIVNVVPLAYSERY